MMTIGRYRAHTILGSGAFATVWLADDPVLEHPVAIKVLAENWSTNGDICERFVAEARILRRIDDPRVVRVYDIGELETGGVARPYFVMAYIGGGTLADRIGDLAPEAALQYGIHAAEALEVLHRNGVVHRDVKPSNLLVEESEDPSRLLISDLGSAKNLAEASGFTVATGTPAYMAPEQIHSDVGIDARADVYALAAVTYELLSGEKPFPSASLAAVLARKANEKPPPIAEKLGQAAELDRVLARALSRDPARRPASAAEFAREIAELRQSPAPAARTVPTVLWLALCVVAAVAAFVIAYLLLR